MDGRMRGAGRGERKMERRGDWPEEGGNPGKLARLPRKGRPEHRPATRDREVRCGGPVGGKLFRTSLSPSPH